MRLIRFVLKFAFICNLCFIAGEILRITAYDHSWDAVINHVIVLGMGIAFPLNLLVCAGTGILLLMKKIAWKQLPPWLYLLNCAILITQLIVNF